MSDRRSFLKSLTAMLAFASIGSGRAAGGRDRLGELLPTRPLGPTGLPVTMLGLGGWHIGRMSERDAQATIEAALEGGIRFFDSAENYQQGGSETRFGQFLSPKYRDVSYIMTKTGARDAKTARAHLEASLRRLKVDRIDLWQVHAITSPDDVDTRVSEGVVDVMLKAKAEGTVRHIGFTGHTRPAAHLRMLERSDAFDACQLPVNVADPSYESFVEGVVPRLVERKVGVLAMKTLGNGGFFGGSQHGEHGDNPKLVPDRLSIAEALRFAWSMPITVLITGPDNAAHLREKVGLARAFTPLSEGERASLVKRVADLAGRRVEFYKG
jgi:uncharacterized protein